MATIGVARPAVPFTLGIDTVADLPPETLRAMRDDPVTPIRWIGIYLGEGNSAAKRDAAFALGLAILPYTFSRAVGWTPANCSGSSDGDQDAAHALDLGIPPGVHLITDLEGCDGNTPETETYLNSRGGRQRAAGYGPGLYVGAGQPLGGVELGKCVQNRYVRALSILKAPGTPTGDVIEPTQGWCVLQLPHTSLFCDVNVDFNIVCYDWLGRVPTLWWPN